MCELSISRTYRALRLEPGVSETKWRITRLPPSNRRTSRADRINWVNGELKKLFTHVQDPVYETIRLPRGVHVYESPAEVRDHIQQATKEMVQLFHEEEAPNSLHEAWLNYTANNPDARKILLFYAPTGEQSPDFYTILVQLERRFPVLAHVVKVYALSFAKLLGVDQETAFEKLHFTIVQYAPNADFRMHIDGAGNSMGNSAGPIFTVSLGKSKAIKRQDGSDALKAGEKILDFLPVLTEYRLDPVRLIIKQGDITVLSGSSRLEYAHAIPEGNPNWMYTMAFKFEHVETAKNHTPVSYNRVLDTEIYDDL